MFGVDVDFGADETVAAVRGDVDALSAPTLRAVLSALIGQDHQRPIVLDLAKLTFMDAAGLSVIVGSVRALAEQSSQLVVRSTPDRTRRIMDITGVVDLVIMDAGAALPDELATVHARRARQRVLDASLGVVTMLANGTVDGAEGSAPPFAEQAG